MTYADRPRKGSAGRLDAYLLAAMLGCLALVLVLVTTGAVLPVTVQADGVTIEAGFSFQVHGLSVVFEDRSEGLIIAWSWSFGDESGKISNVKKIGRAHV